MNSYIHVSTLQLPEYFLSLKMDHIATVGIIEPNLT